MLIGNGPTDLHRIAMVGNDLALDGGIGTCGKNGQGVRSASASRRCGWTRSPWEEPAHEHREGKPEGAAKTPKPTTWRGQAMQLVAIVAVVFVAKGALAEPFYVPSGSMEPTLLIGDALLASKFAYGYGTSSMPIQINLPETGRVFAGTPKHGDVVVFRYPGNRSQAWVKRVVGLPGDRIQLRQGQLFINDRAAQLKPDGMGSFRRRITAAASTAYRYIETLPGGVSHLIFKMRDKNRLDNTPEVTVPPDRLFVLGDNRDNSADSRVAVRDGGVGLLPMDNLVGRADAVVGSWDLGMRKQPVWTWLSGFRVARFFTAVQLVETPRKKRGNSPRKRGFPSLRAKRSNPSITATNLKMDCFVASAPRNDVASRHEPMPNSSPPRFAIPSMLRSSAELFRLALPDAWLVVGMPGADRRGTC